MRIFLLTIPMAILAGCASGDMAFYSPYDLDRNGVMDARCPGMEYDVKDYTLYGWRSDGSVECAKQVPMTGEAPVGEVTPAAAGST